MQFVGLIYQGTTPLPNTPAWDALSPDEQKQIYADYGAFNKTPGLQPVPALGLPDAARTVRVKDGTVDAAAGPYVGVDGAVGGIFVLEADDLDAAIAIAARIPAARLGGAVEIRPVATYW
jgi:hypothetical protein